MEYEFSQDMLGSPVARFSMDHEAFGFWLEDELVGQAARLTQLLAEVGALQQGRGWAFELAGREYRLLLDRDEATVAANALFQEDDWQDEEMALSDEGQRAGCGLDDFAAMLADWQRYLMSIGH